MIGVYEKKPFFILTFIIFLAIWASKWNEQIPQRDYWNKVPRFIETNVDFHTPNPRDQSVLFKTVSEIISPMPAKVTGKVPDWLEGTLLRNGPGLFEFDLQKADHIFDGMAMIRRYQIGSKNSEMNVSRQLIKSEFLQEK